MSGRLTVQFAWMFLGHMAVGLAGKRAVPEVSLATWLAAAQFVDLLWPVCLMAGLEHVRITPGITAFTPLDFYDYPITHSLIGGLCWAVLFGGAYAAMRRHRIAGVLLGAGVLSHWVLDLVVHRPDLPVLPHGPYVGLGLWDSIAGTLVTELSLFAAGVALYLRSRFAGTRRMSFWLLIAFLLASYVAAAFGPPAPNVRILAITGLAMWLLLPWACWADR